MSSLDGHSDGRNRLDHAFNGRRGAFERRYQIDGVARFIAVGWRFDSQYNITFNLYSGSPPLKVIMLS